MVKLIVYLLLAYVAWSFLRRLLAQLGRAPAGQGGAQSRAGRPAEPAQVGAQDLVQCAVCGSYVAARCSRTNCPQ